MTITRTSLTETVTCDTSTCWRQYTHVYDYSDVALLTASIPTPGEALVEAIEQGWSFDQQLGDHYCPECSS